MSNRVMNILEGFVPKVEVYSIDEAFLELDSQKKIIISIVGCYIRGLQNNGQAFQLE